MRSKGTSIKTIALVFEVIGIVLCAIAVFIGVVALADGEELGIVVVAA